MIRLTPGSHISKGWQNVRQEKIGCCLGITLDSKVSRRFSCHSTSRTLQFLLEKVEKRCSQIYPSL